MATSALGLEDPELPLIRRIMQGDVSDLELVDDLLDSDGFKALQVGGGNGGSTSTSTSLVVLVITVKVFSQ